jgi:hypothetical protein
LSNDHNTEDSVSKSNDEQISALVSRLTDPLYHSRFWINLFAACLIVYGALITVTGIGVLVAWIPLWIGVLLILTTKSIKAAYTGRDEKALLKSLNRLKSIFTILGLASVMLIVATVYLVKYALVHSLI